VEDLGQQKKALESLNSEQSAALATLSEHAAAAEAQSAQLREAVNESRGECSALQSRLGNAEEAHSATSRRLADSQSAVAAAEELVESLRLEAASAEERARIAMEEASCAAETHRRDSEALASELSSCRDRLSDLQLTAGEKDALIHNVTVELARLLPPQSAPDTTATVDAVVALVARLRCSLAATDAARESLDRRVTADSQDRAAAGQALDAREAELDAREADVLARLTAASTAEAAADMLMVKVEAKLLDCEATQRDIDQSRSALVAEREKLQSDVVQLGAEKTRIEDVRAELDAGRHAVDDLTRLLADHQLLVAAAQTELDASAEAAAARDAELARLSTALEAALEEAAAHARERVQADAARAEVDADLSQCMADLSAARQDAATMQASFDASVTELRYKVSLLEEELSSAPMPAVTPDGAAVHGDGDQPPAQTTPSAPSTPVTPGAVPSEGSYQQIQAYADAGPLSVSEVELLRTQLAAFEARVAELEDATDAVAVSVAVCTCVDTLDDASVAAGADISIVTPPSSADVATDIMPSAVTAFSGPPPHLIDADVLLLLQEQLAADKDAHSRNKDALDAERLALDKLNDELLVRAAVLEMKERDLREHHDVEEALRAREDAVAAREHAIMACVEDAEAKLRLVQERDDVLSAQYDLLREKSDDAAVRARQVADLEARVLADRTLVEEKEASLGHRETDLASRLRAVSEREQRVALTEQQLDSVRVALEASQARVTSREQAIADATTLVHDRERAASQLQLELDSARRDLTDHQERLDASEKSVRAQEAELASARRELASLRAEAASMSAAAAQLQKDLEHREAQLQHTIALHNADAERLCSDLKLIRDREATLSARAAAIDAREASLQSREGDIAPRELALAEAERKLATEREVLARQEADMQVLRSDVDERERRLWAQEREERVQVDDLAARRQQLVVACSELEDAVENKRQLVSVWEREGERIHQERLDAEAVLRDARAQSSLLDADVAKMSAEHHRLTQLNDQLKSSETSLQKTLLQLQREVSGVEQESRAASAQLQQTRELVKTHTRALQQAEQDRDALRDEIHTLQQTTATLAAEREVAETGLTAAEAALRRATEQLQHTQRDTQVARDDLGRISAERATQEAQLSATAAKVLEEEASLARLQSETHTLTIRQQECRSQVDAALRELSALEARARDEAARVERVMGAQEKKEAELDQLTSRVAVKNRDLDELDQQFRLQEARLHELRADLVRAEERHGKASRETSAMEAEQAVLREACEAQAMALEELRRERDDAERAVAELASQRTTLSEDHQQHVALVREAALLKAVVETLTAEAEARRAEMATLMRDVDILRAARGDLAAVPEDEDEEDLEIHSPLPQESGRMSSPSWAQSAEPSSSLLPYMPSSSPLVPKPKHQIYEPIPVPPTARPTPSMSVLSPAAVPMVETASLLFGSTPSLPEVPASAPPAGTAPNVVIPVYQAYTRPRSPSPPPSPPSSQHTAVMDALLAMANSSAASSVMTVFMPNAASISPTHSPSSSSSSVDLASTFPHAPVPMDSDAPMFSPRGQQHDTPQVPVIPPSLAPFLSLLSPDLLASLLHKIKRGDLAAFQQLISLVREQSITQTRSLDTHRSDAQSGPDASTSAYNASEQPASGSDSVGPGDSDVDLNNLFSSPRPTQRNDSSIPTEFMSTHK
jgi:chromosome segregation ATPase